MLRRAGSKDRRAGDTLPRQSELMLESTIMATDDNDTDPVEPGG
jgi:hypothetical protein